MKSKQSGLIYIVTGILTLLLIGFALYVTVFDELVNQNEGFFFAIVFGGILILAYLLCNLISKLLAVSINIQQSTAARIVSLVVFGLMAAGICYIRMPYVSSLPADAAYCKAAEMLNKGILTDNFDVVKEIIVNPSNFVYALICAPFVKAFGMGARVFMVINAVFIILSAYLAYRIAYRVTDRACGLFAAFVCLFMPSQSFTVYSYGTDPIISFLFLAFLDSVIVLITERFIPDSEEHDKLVESGLLSFGDKHARLWIIISIVCASLFGSLLLLADPIMFAPAIIVIGGSILMNRDKTVYLLVIIAASLILFIGGTYVKSVVCDVSVEELTNAYVDNFDVSVNVNTGNSFDSSEVYSNFCAGINSYNKTIEDNFYFLTSDSGKTVNALFVAWLKLFNQMIYMFVLVMSVSCSFFTMRDKRYRVMPVLLGLVGSYIAIFLQSGRNINYFYYICLLTVVGSVNVHYMYLNYHREEEELLIRKEQAIREAAERIALRSSGVKVEYPSAMSEEEEANFLKRANALIFIGYDNELYQQIKREENPKRHLKAVENIVGEQPLTEQPIADNPKPVDVFDAQDSSASKPHVTIYENTFDDYDEGDAPAAESMTYFDEDEYITPAGQPIPNPLPEPKKHEHTGMDYPEEFYPPVVFRDPLMEWDYEITDSKLADFDYN